ncbi:MAG: APC family permease [Gemmatimonadetes bacterium]|nr:APC family permease [Gemmatimonadota bacterium]
MDARLCLYRRCRLPGHLDRLDHHGPHPGIEGPVLYRSLGTEVHAGTLALGLTGMAGLTWLNYRGVKGSGRAQYALVVVLLVMATAFVLTGILRGNVANLQPYFQRSESGSIWPGARPLHDGVVLVRRLQRHSRDDGGEVECHLTTARSGA